MLIHCFWTDVAVSRKMLINFSKPFAASPLSATTLQRTNKSHQQVVKNGTGTQYLWGQPKQIFQYVTFSESLGYLQQSIEIAPATQVPELQRT